MTKVSYSHTRAVWGGHENKVEKEVVVSLGKVGSVYTRLCAYQTMVLSVLVCILKSTSSQAMSSRVKWGSVFPTLKQL